MTKSADVVGTTSNFYPMSVGGLSKDMMTQTTYVLNVGDVFIIDYDPFTAPMTSMSRPLIFLFIKNKGYFCLDAYGRIISAFNVMSSIETHAQQYIKIISRL